MATRAVPLLDLKFLIRAITSTQAYQRTSALANTSETTDKRLFARMPVRGLSAEQLFDSLAEAREIVGSWRQYYNHARPHLSLRKLTPSEFAELQGGTVP